MTTVEAPPALECPSCGSGVSRGQEYCLECGARLPLPEGDAVQGSASWLVPVLVALVVVLNLAARRLLRGAKES